MTISVTSPPSGGAGPRPGGKTGHWYGPVGGARSTGIIVNQALHATPIWLDAGSYDRIGVLVTTAGTSSTVNALLYANAGGVPGALLVDGLAISGDSASFKVTTITFSVPTGGWYFGAVHSLFSTTGATISQIGGFLMADSDATPVNGDYNTFRYTGLASPSSDLSAATIVSGTGGPMVMLRRA